jgi:hypothetical protein
MADTTGIQPYNYPASAANQFERLGHPGKFHKSISCTTGTTVFTASNFGVGGIIVPSGTTGTASLSLGGDIPLSILAAGTVRLYELSLSSIKVDSGTVYVLIRNQLAK